MQYVQSKHIKLSLHYLTAEYYIVLKMIVLN